MRYIATATAILVATSFLHAEGPPKATRVINGKKSTFPDKSIRDGVKALAGAIESCHSASDGTVKYTAEDLKKAQEGDHVRFVFSHPLAVDVLDKELDASEVVFAKGVFWLVCAKEIVRCTKYEHEKMKLFEDWYRQTLRPV